MIDSALHEDRQLGFQYPRMAGSSSFQQSSQGSESKVTGRYQDSESLPNKRKRPLYDGSPSSCVGPQPRKRISFGDTCRSPRSEQTVTVLLPNSTQVVFSPPSEECPNFLHTFLSLAQRKAQDRLGELVSEGTRNIQWGPQIWLEDYQGKRITGDDALRKALTHPTVLLQDGHADARHSLQWDITPDPHVLGRLPQGYNLEYALADEVDNALQAIWNVTNRRRLISVDIQPSCIRIFDTGLGMDATSLSNWATIGRTTHLDVHKEAIGGKPPYLKPYLGKYGAGGVAAALHLGSVVNLSSKTTKSDKVVTLELKKEELDKRRISVDRDPANKWKVPGRFREMTAEEKQKAGGGSFTMVELTNLKRQYSRDIEREISRTRRLLADIYFYYIHSDEYGVPNMSLKHPIEIEVNGENLIGIDKCETAISNVRTCKGKSFVIDLVFKGPIEDPTEGGRSRSQNRALANAQIACCYYPNIKGKEELDSLCEELAELGLCSKSFEDLPRVVVRWLGRLLPQNGWGQLPFMKVQGKRVAEGWKTLWAKRVRATVFVDAGFHPTQSKTQLERDQPFTVALQNLGDPEAAKRSSAADVEIVIKVKGKVVDSKQLNDEYMQWLKLMHDNYDEEVEFLDKDPIYLVEPASDLLGPDKDLANVLIVFYKHMKDKQGEWNAEGSNPLHIKIPRRAAQNSTDIYATVEWFYCQGSGDEHGEVRVICRPLEVAEEDGSTMTLKNGRAIFCLNKSQHFPWTLLKSSTVHRVSQEEWTKKEEEFAKKAPGFIEILSEKESKAFDCDKTLPSEMHAGSLSKFLAVVRPKQGSGVPVKQGMIHPKALDLKLCVSICKPVPPPHKSGSNKSLPIIKQLIWEGSVKGDHVSNNVKGLYLFDPKALGLESKLTRPGTYTFKFELVTPGYQVKSLERRVSVIPSEKSEGWKLCIHKGLCDEEHPNTAPCLVTRLKEQLTQELILGKLDIFGNLQTLSRIPAIKVSLETLNGDNFLAGSLFNATDIKFSPDKKHLILGKKVLFNQGSLERIAPTHEAQLILHIKDGRDSKTPGFAKEDIAKMRCRVYPGEITMLEVKDSPELKSGLPLWFKDPVHPETILDVLSFQGKDWFGNLVEKGQQVEVQLEGLVFQDKVGSVRQVDEQGLLNLGGLLKVTGAYNSKCSICIYSEQGRRGRKRLLELALNIASRSLQIASQVQSKYIAGSLVQGIAVEVLDANGIVDTTADGPYHSLTIDWMPNVICPIKKGRCELPDIRLPRLQGQWCGQIYHTVQKSLKLELKLDLEYGIARRLALESDETLSARCDESFKLKFEALDDQGLPAYLTAGMLDRITFELDSKKSKDLGTCSVVCERIVATNSALPTYEAHLRIGGQQGDYMVHLRSPDFRVISGSAAILTWSIQLEHGNLQKLAMVDEDFQIPNMSLFPGIRISLLDAYNNACFDHELENLTMVIEKTGTTIHKETQVHKACGKFAPFTFKAGEGSYKVTVSLSSKNIVFFLKVTAGNYPASLRLIDTSKIHVTLSAEVQHLPQLGVLVSSADNQPLQNIKPPVLTIIYEGCERRRYEGELSDSGEFTPSLYFVFSQVYVPLKAGPYIMNFSLVDYDVPQVHRNMFVRHGAPALIKLSMEELEMRQCLEAKLIDAHGNLCDSVGGLQLILAVEVVGKEGFERGKSLQNLVNHERSVVEGGIAKFDDSQLYLGKDGIYSFCVSIEEDQKLFRHFSSLLPAELQMRSHLNALEAEEKRQVRQKQLEAELAARRRELAMIETDSRNANEQLQRLVNERTTQFPTDPHDEEILRRERDQPIRGAQEVYRDIENQARTGRFTASSAFLEACQGGNFLSPQASNEGVGLPVTLARVESEDLNQVLCEYIGPHMLLIPLCRTQHGVNSLERKRADKSIDPTFGLRAVARFPIKNKYSALALTDVHTWLGAVDERHPQLLLKGLPTPYLMEHGQKTPFPGFLGFAVNLLHLSEEQLAMKVAVNNRAAPNRLFGLRESLFYHLLRELQVYKSREDMNAAKAKGFVKSGAISLDGYIIKPNMLQQLGESSSTNPVTFALVPFEERLHRGSIFPPASEAFARRKREESTREQRTARQREIEEVRSTCELRMRDLEKQNELILSLQKELQEISRRCSKCTGNNTLLSNRLHFYPL